MESNWKYVSFTNGCRQLKGCGHSLRGAPNATNNNFSSQKITCYNLTQGCELEQTDRSCALTDRQTGHVLSHTDRPVVCSHIRTDQSCAPTYRQTGHVLSYRQTGRVLSYTDRPVVCSHIQTDRSCALIYRQTGRVLSYTDRPVMCSHMQTDRLSALIYTVMNLQIP